VIVCPPETVGEKFTEQLDSSTPWAVSVQLACVNVPLPATEKLTVESGAEVPEPVLVTVAVQVLVASTSTVAGAHDTAVDVVFAGGIPGVSRKPPLLAAYAAVPP
jgi:hypothetical protein